jgi:pimeloyl-ACP methyl ester carboxylesterase
MAVLGTARSTSRLRSRLVEVRGARLHVAEAGDADAPAIVLQHGWPKDGRVWDKVWPDLARDRRVICPDMRGSGRSDAPQHGYEKEELAADLLGLLDVLELERVDYVGHDWGGFIGFLAALRAPERFRRLVVVAVSHPWGSSNPLAILDAWRGAYAAALAMPLVGPRGLQAIGALARVAGHHDLGQFADPARAQATQKLYRGFILREAPAIAAGRYRNQTLQVPALYIHPANDPVVTARVASGWERGGANVRFARLEGVGHAVPQSAPDALLALVRPFLETESPNPRQ